MRLIIICCVLAISVTAGCRSMRPNYSLFKSDAEEETDRLWRSGYGYNNPNIERRRNGQKPLNFDGSVHEPTDVKSAANEFGGRILGNIVAFTIFEGIPAIWNGLTRR